MHDFLPMSLSDLNGRGENPTARGQTTAIRRGDIWKARMLRRAAWQNGKSSLRQTLQYSAPSHLWAAHHRPLLLQIGLLIGLLHLSLDLRLLLVVLLHLLHGLLDAWSRLADIQHCWLSKQR